VRIRALELLSSGERSVSGLLEEMDVAQPYLSQQLGVLRRTGFVVTRREGPNVMYALADQRIVELLAVSRQMLLDSVTDARRAQRGVTKPRRALALLPGRDDYRGVPGVVAR
jgi:DNA-binding transcriptional ArsR family regulator